MIGKYRESAIRVAKWMALTYLLMAGGAWYTQGERSLRVSLLLGAFAIVVYPFAVLIDYPYRRELNKYQQATRQASGRARTTPPAP